MRIHHIEPILLLKVSLEHRMFDRQSIIFEMITFLNVDITEADVIIYWMRGISSLDAYNLTTLQLSSVPLHEGWSHKIKYHEDNNVSIKLSCKGWDGITW